MGQEKRDALEELINHMTGEWLSDHLMKNDDYVKASESAEELFELFDQTMTEEQKRLYADYTLADDRASAIAAEFTYKQGMKDLLQILSELKK